MALVTIFFSDVDGMGADPNAKGLSPKVAGGDPNPNGLSPKVAGGDPNPKGVIPNEEVPPNEVGRDPKRASMSSCDIMFLGFFREHTGHVTLSSVMGSPILNFK